ncbi:unnamed protein product [Diamesa serratosioi]
MWKLIIFLLCNLCLKVHSNDDEIIDLSKFGERLFGQPVLNNGRSFQRSTDNPEEQGPYIEGDILVPVQNNATRNGMKTESLRWRGGVIPFVIRGSFNAREMDLLERAINEYHRKTCIKFVRRQSNDYDYISIENAGSGCWSSVGRTGGKQVVNLQSPGCVSKIGTPLHELMHALGFLHEQNREERDGFVTIKNRNIKPGYEANFDKAPRGATTGFGVGYDYGSVMHYSPTAFSRNGQPTIEAKSNSRDKMGQREGFSNKDLEKINKMYNCKGTTASVTNKPLGTTTKPDNSFGNLIGSLFPNWDEDEMIVQ